MYKNAICGCGPAGLGLIVNAIVQNKLDELLSHGLILIDKTEKIGAGDIQNYRIRANNLGGPFIESIEKSSSQFALKVQQHDTFKKLQKLKDVDPNLQDVYPYLSYLGLAILDEIASHPNVKLFLNHQLVSIDHLKSGKLKLTLQENTTHQEETAEVENTFLNLGGTQSIEALCQCKIADSISLETYREKLITSNQLISLTPEEVQEKIECTTREEKNIVIIGGSHSAYSSALKLMEAVEQKQLALPSQSITIVHRHPFKLYFNSANEALTSGYAFKQEDICPLTGVVNRFGGLRYEPRDLASEILKLTPSTARARYFKTLQINASDHNTNILEPLLDEASLIVGALGYRPNTIPIYDTNGNSISLKYDRYGIVTSNQAEVLTEADAPLTNIYTWGLSSGFRPNAEIGGEPSFKGRAEGVWHYHHTVGNIVLAKALN